MPSVHLAADFRLAPDFFAVDFFAADFLAVDFFAADFLAVDFFAADFLTVDFAAVDFLVVDFLAVDFAAALFFAVDFFAVLFLAMLFLAADFLAVLFFAVDFAVPFVAASFAVDFLAVLFLAVAFFGVLSFAVAFGVADFLAADFLAVDLLAALFFAVDFRAAAFFGAASLSADFRAVDFFAVDLRPDFLVATIVLLTGRADRPGGAPDRDRSGPPPTGTNGLTTSRAWDRTVRLRAGVRRCRGGHRSADGIGSRACARPIRTCGRRPSADANTVPAVPTVATANVGFAAGAAAAAASQPLHFACRARAPRCQRMDAGGRRPPAVCWPAAAGRVREPAVDPKFVEYYGRELRRLREQSREFAAQYPKIARRLALDESGCADPYVERLLEGFAFLTARVSLKQDSEFGRFTEQLLDLVYPHYLTPTPSMAVLQLEPPAGKGALTEGYRVPRGSLVKSLHEVGAATRCEFATAHEVVLWPFRIDEARFFASNLHGSRGVQAVLRLTVQTHDDLPFAALGDRDWPLYLRGDDERPVLLYQQLLGNAVDVLVWPDDRPDAKPASLGRRAFRPVGMRDDEALLPPGDASFRGYRLLHEYFAFPQRFHFAALQGLGPATRALGGHRFRIDVLLDRADPLLAREGVSAEQFVPCCTPAINLFERSTDRIPLRSQANEYHAVVDRTRPGDHEIFDVLRVEGFGAQLDRPQPFRRFFTLRAGQPAAEQAYYTLHRERRLATRRRSGYVGSETFLSLIDGAQAPYRSDLRQLGVRALVTNRDLPWLLREKGQLGFALPKAPVRAVRALAGPSDPRPSYTYRLGSQSWRLVSHLTLNYLSLTDGDPQRGPVALKELLALYCPDGSGQAQRRIAALERIAVRPVVRRLRTPRPITYGRGLEVTLTAAAEEFTGEGIFLFAAVLGEFFARYATVNSFVETTLRTQTGEQMRWEHVQGRRPVL